MRRLTTVSTLIEATLLQHALELEGIASFSTNVNSSTMLPHYFGMLGHGIQIMVREVDYEQAIEILEAKRIRNNTSRCPVCGSKDLGFGLQGKRRWKDRIFVLLSVFFAVPMGNIRSKYFCKACGEDFQQ